MNLILFPRQWPKDQRASVCRVLQTYFPILSVEVGQLLFCDVLSCFSYWNIINNKLSFLNLCIIYLVSGVTFMYLYCSLYLILDDLLLVMCSLNL